MNERRDGDGHEVRLWNVDEGVPIYAGAQRIVNLLGSVERPQEVESLTYSLNDRRHLPVFFKRAGANAARLARPGDFNIDTVERDHLESLNTLELSARLKNGTSRKQVVRFPVGLERNDEGRFRLDLGRVKHAQEVGQVVDGHWRVDETAAGERFLGIREEDCGLDRIILFGDRRLRDGYTVRSRLCITAWLGNIHNIGLLFKWNPHLQGDGTWLPSQWSTGLGYFYSHCRGLRIRVGVDVHVNDRGDKVGDHILGEAMLSPARHGLSRLARLVSRGRRSFPQIVPGRHYVFELRVERDLYQLTVWPHGRRKPSPQVAVRNPPELLREGSVGIIAHRCGVRVFDFEIEPTG